MYTVRHVTSEGLPYYQVPDFNISPRFLHAFFGRIGGVSPAPYGTLNVGALSGDSPGNVAENLRRVAAVLGFRGDEIIAARQIHGSAVIRVQRDHGPRSLFRCANAFEGDALITDEPGICLGILTADCLPVLLVDTVRGVAGAAHAGWRGTLANVAGATVRAMEEAYGSRPEDLLAALGPAIGPCCYRVGEEVAQAFLQQDPRLAPFIRHTSDDGRTLDLAGINRKLLIDLGLQSGHIFMTGLCTRCNCHAFFSVRAAPDPTGRQVALVGLRRN